MIHHLVYDNYEYCSLNYCILQIADFGMARDVADDTYYFTSGGKVPLKWTAPEVWMLHKQHMS